MGRSDANAAVRNQQFENLWGGLQQSLRAGESVLILRGRTSQRGWCSSHVQVASAEYLAEAELARVRPVEAYKLWRQNKALRNWATQTVAYGAALPVLYPPLATPVQCVATGSSHLRLAVEGQVTLCTRKHSGDIFAWDRPKCLAWFKIAPASF